MSRRKKNKKQTKDFVSLLKLYLFNLILVQKINKQKDIHWVIVAHIERI